MLYYIINARARGARECRRPSRATRRPRRTNPGRRRGHERLCGHDADAGSAKWGRDVMRTWDRRCGTATWCGRGIGDFGPRRIFHLPSAILRALLFRGRGCPPGPPAPFSLFSPKPCKKVVHSVEKYEKWRFYRFAVESICNFTFSRFFVEKINFFRKISFLNDEKKKLRGFAFIFEHFFFGDIIAPYI